MNKPFFIIGLLLLSFLNGLCQPLLSGGLVAERVLNSAVRPEILNKEYIGSPYLIDTFVTGMIYMKDKTTFKLPMRYNIYDDVLEIKHLAREMQLLPSDLIAEVKMAGHTLAVNEYEYGKSKMKSFLFVLDTGEIDLVVRKTVKFEPWRAARAQETGPKYAEFKPSLDYYYLILKNGKLTPITKVKEIPDLLSKNRRAVETFMKKNKTKMRQDKLTELVKYYNAL